jgi:hypothetical protein
MVSLCTVQNASLANCGKPCRTDQLLLFSASQPCMICILHLSKKWIDERQLYIIMLLWSSDQWVSFWLPLPLYSISSTTKLVIWIMEVFDWSSSSSELTSWNQLVIKNMVFQIELTFKEPNITYVTVQTWVNHRIINNIPSCTILCTSETLCKFFGS